MINTNTQSSSLGETFFKYRDYTPIPLILIVLFVAKPSVFTATLGTIVLTFGELFRIYSVAFIGSISRTRKESLGNQLITSGPFKWVRNPLYLGNFFIVFGRVSKPPKRCCQWFLRSNTLRAMRSSSLRVQNPFRLSSTRSWRGTEQTDLMQTLQEWEAGVDGIGFQDFNEEEPARPVSSFKESENVIDPSSPVKEEEEGAGDQEEGAKEIKHVEENDNLERKRSIRFNDDPTTTKEGDDTEKQQGNDGIDETEKDVTEEENSNTQQQEENDAPGGVEDRC